jgi:hypothetical protein
MITRLMVTHMPSTVLDDGALGGVRHGLLWCDASLDII